MLHHICSTIFPLGVKVLHMYIRTCMHACICTLHLCMYLHAYVDKRIFVVDLDNMEAILKEYDDNLIHKATPDNILGLIDASSLLWRLEVVNVGRIIS